MPAKPLSKEQLEDADRLKKAHQLAKRQNPSLSQAQLAFDCGWNTQGAVSQYMTGKIPLNIEALVKLSRALGVKPEQISPKLSAELQFYSNSISADPSQEGFHATQVNESPLAGLTSSARLTKIIKKLCVVEQEKMLSEQGYGLLEAVVTLIETPNTKKQKANIKRLAETRDFAPALPSETKLTSSESGSYAELSNAINNETE